MIANLLKCLYYSLLTRERHERARVPVQSSRQLTTPGNQKAAKNFTLYTRFHAYARVNQRPEKRVLNRFGITYEIAAGAMRPRNDISFGYSLL